MRKAILPLAMVLSVFDPMVACEDDGDRPFEYGEAEMRAAIEGTWMLVVQKPGHAAEHYTLVIREAGDTKQEHAERTVIRSASACTTRDFIRQAGACYDASLMRIAIEVVSGPARDGGGHFEAPGTTFVGGTLDVTIGDLELYGFVSPQGYVVQLHESHEDTAVTLLRART